MPDCYGRPPSIHPSCSLGLLGEGRAAPAPPRPRTSWLSPGADICMPLPAAFTTASASILRGAAHCRSIGWSFPLRLPSRRSSLPTSDDSLLSRAASHLRPARRRPAFIASCECCAPSMRWGRALRCDPLGRRSFARAIGLVAASQPNQPRGGSWIRPADYGRVVRHPSCPVRSSFTDRRNRPKHSCFRRTGLADERPAPRRDSRSSARSHSVRRARSD